MTKRRVTLTLDEDVIEALRRRDARSLSAAANESLREALEAYQHRAAAVRWLQDLDDRYGAATPAERADNEAWLDEIGFGRSGAKAAGAA